MPSRILVALAERSYPIITASEGLSELGRYLPDLKLSGEALVITNPLVWRCQGRHLSAALAKAGIRFVVARVEDSEKSKSMPVALDLVDRAIRMGRDRKVFVIAFGGGVVGDLAGFVAAITKRGLPLVQIPTTLLAMIDSAIGGKVAVDLPAGKNLVGVYYQPRLVLSDPRLLTTLSARQIRNGLAEAVKYGVIADERLFALIEREHAALAANASEVMEKVIYRCAAIKAAIVSRDERETRGLRMVLNFGHTIGHAIEAAGGYDRYQHGEAVALGMRAAAAISVRLGLLKALDAARLETLLTALGLPDSAQGLTLREVLKFMKFDKKFSGKTNRFVLARRIGEVVVRENVPVSLVAASIRNILS